MTPPAAAYRWPARRVIAAICAAWWLLSAVATHVPIESMPVPVSEPSILHVIGYAIITALFLTTLIAYGVRSPRRCLIAAVVIAAYAAADEATQPWFGRDGTVGDWIADLIGTAFTLAVIEVPAALARLRQRVTTATHRSRFRRSR